MLLPPACVQNGTPGVDSSQPASQKLHRNSPPNFSEPQHPATAQCLPKPMPTIHSGTSRGGPSGGAEKRWPAGRGNVSAAGRARARSFVREESRSEPRGRPSLAASRSGASPQRHPVLGARPSRLGGSLPWGEPGQASAARERAARRTRLARGSRRRCPGGQGGPSEGLGAPGRATRVRRGRKRK